MRLSRVSKFHINKADTKVDLSEILSNFTTLKMHYKALLSILTLAGILPSMTFGRCEGGRQFCCATEEVPNKQVGPNLWLFVYGLGCSKLYINQGAILAKDLYRVFRGARLGQLLRFSLFSA